MNKQKAFTIGDMVRRAPDMHLTSLASLAGPWSPALTRKHALYERVWRGHASDPKVHADLSRVYPDYQHHYKVVCTRPGWVMVERDGLRYDMLSILLEPLD